MTNHDGEYKIRIKNWWKIKMEDDNLRWNIGNQDGGCEIKMEDEKSRWRIKMLE